MKNKTTLALILGVVSAFATLGFQGKAYNEHLRYEPRVPQRLVQISEELSDLRRQYGCPDLFYVSQHPELIEIQNKYTSLTSEQQTYLANPEINEAIKALNESVFEYGLAGICAGLSIISGTIGIAGMLKKRN